MNLWDGVLDRFASERRPQKDEYLGDDGLIYCSKCHTPKQCRVQFMILPCSLYR